ncbi:hypothetical protein [Cloacibacillus porcorum]|uniref:hypothetical protein n=1 Tax=Cloacibacillus porcorum TaxID=1197717 RepID=UPI00248D4C97|nr:hypothetical protein [Cloacibacillus porcorum]
MLKSTFAIYNDYGPEAKKRSAELAKKTLEQIHREYLETVFTAACRRRLDIWDFAQKFMESDFARSLDRPETLLALTMDEVFRDFMVRCAQSGVEIESVPNKKTGMAAFRDISPEAKWLVGLYSKWHAKTGEAGCEIAERAPAALLKKIHKKAMTHRTDEIIALLIENSAEAAMITSKDYERLEGLEREP